MDVNQNMITAQLVITRQMLYEYIQSCNDHHIKLAIDPSSIFKLLDAIEEATVSLNELDVVSRMDGLRGLETILEFYDAGRSIKRANTFNKRGGAA